MHPEQTTQKTRGGGNVNNSECNLRRGSYGPCNTCLLFVTLSLTMTLSTRAPDAWPSPPPLDPDYRGSFGLQGIRMHEPDHLKLTRQVAIADRPFNVNRTTHRYCQSCYYKRTMLGINFNIPKLY